ncbi:JmjC domain-containing protein [Streptacidiphilus sp. N1-12]|uniref:JmjC domain-containing protein n=2 Tax=Streptacidiphilus alkalitolerans TaxID=3342712 RepID=A0ABV6VC36_9ACTN
MDAFNLPADFFDNYWRRRPLHLPGAAAAFLPQAPARDQIFGMIEGGAAHQTDGSTVWFLEGLTAGLPGLAEVVDRTRRLFEWHDVWCDVFATAGPSTIGSHYDGSDNFSIQLTGNKKWFLCPPDGIDPDDRRRRVLGEPGLGPAPVPESALAFQVRAGDVLYIPSTWIHWGLSDGDSTSVSLVLNVATPLHALQAQLLDGLRHDPRWSALLPVGPGSTAARERALRGLIADDLPQRLRDPALARIGDREGSRLSVKELPVGGSSSPVAAPEGAQSEQPPEQPLGRLLDLCRRRLRQTSDQDARRLYLAVLTAVPGLPQPLLDSLAADPDLAAWLASAQRDSRITRSTRAEDPQAHALGLLLLPELAPALAEPVAVTVRPDPDGTLTLARTGLQLSFPSRPARVTLGVLDGVLHLLGPDGPTPVLPGARTAELEVRAAAPQRSALISG